MSRKIIIGDIHGCLTTFEALLDKMDFSKSDTLYLVGDYIDRGPNSKGVIDKIIELRKEGYQIIAIRGNHEQMLINDYESETIKGWYSNADEQLLQSFGIDSLKDFPEQYISFCKELLFYHTEEDFIIVHAGLNFDNKDPLTSKKDLLWIRDWHHSVNKDWLGDRVIIHGHTMQSRQETEAQLENLKQDQVIDIDCGAVMSQSKTGLGYLCGFDFTNKKLYFQKNIEVNNNY